MRMRVELRTTSGIKGDAYYDGSRWREPQGELSHLFEWQATFAMVGRRSSMSRADGMLTKVDDGEEAGSIFVYVERGHDPGFPSLERAARWAADNSSLDNVQLDVALAFFSWSEARESRLRDVGPRPPKPETSPE